MPIIPFQDKHPTIGKNVFIAPDAWVIGDVTLADNVTVLFGAVLRGDILPITVGEGSNIQDHSMLHTSHDQSPCSIGAAVTVGHRAILHGCSVSDGCLIGMGATVLDNATVGTNAIVGAQSLVPVGMAIPESKLAVGVPAKVRREVTEEDRKVVELGVESYKEVGSIYQKYFDQTS